MALTTEPSPSLGRPRLTDELTSAGRYIILAAAFLGWMFSGFQMAVMTLSSRAATTDFLRSGQVSASAPLDLTRLMVAPHWPRRPPPASEGERAEVSLIAAKWFSWYNAAFLLG